MLLLGDNEDDYWSRCSATARGGEETIQYEENAIPCELCGELFPFSCLELHEVSFLNSKFLFEKYDNFYFYFFFRLSHRLLVGFLTCLLKRKEVLMKKK